MSRALVLSGGGPVGIAWQTGLAAGLAAAGVDLADADLFVGTSAGSAVGAQVALGRDMGAQVERLRDAATRRGAEAPSESRGGPRRGPGLAGLMGIMGSVAGLEPEERLRKIGRFALDAETGPEEDFIGTFSYLRGQGWPTPFVCTAIDAETGKFVTWGADAGVEVDRAVASSCAVPGIFPPITIAGRRYIDGGMRSVTNADLAAGHDRVLILSVVAGRVNTSASEEAALREAGSTVATIAPDDKFTAAIGMNLMDGSKTADAVELGLAQGEREAAEWRSFWCDT